MIADAALGPTVNAGITIKRITARDGTWNVNASVTSLVQALSAQTNAVKSGDLGRAEEMLLAQAHTLDALFHSMVARSLANSQAGNLDGSETYMRLALRAQSQSRATLETLSVVKNPPSVAFVRQANIANGPQQVNNRPRTSKVDGNRRQKPVGASPLQQVAPLAHEKQKIRKPDYWSNSNERLDAGAAKAAGRTDPALETMGALNGAPDARRSGTGSSQPV